jgi:hypothetical protein
MTVKCLASKASILIWAATAYSVVAQVPLPEMSALQGSGISILTQDVSVSVAEFAIVSVSASTASLTVSDGNEAVNNSTTYSITVNGGSKKLTGVLDADYSGTVALDIELSPPPGAVASRQTLNTSVLDLVTGIGHTAGADLVVTYYGNASPSEPPNGAGETRTVTITLTDS